MKWEIKAQADETVADIHINDFIGDWIDDYWGFGVTSKQFIKELSELPESVKTLRLHLNSPGGDVTAANHIANTLRDQRTAKGRQVEVLIEGAAWSAATIISSAGQPTKIADNALMMIHDPWTIALGNARDLREQADLLDKFRDSIIAAYQWKSPLNSEELIELMADETWMNAEEALTYGFADEIIGGVQIAACLDQKMLKKLPSIPDQYKERINALTISSPPTNSGTSPGNTGAEPPAAPVASSSAIEVIVAPEQEDIETALARARTEASAIVALCVENGVPDMAEGFFSSGVSVDVVKGGFKDAQAIRDACAAAGMPERAGNYIRAGLSTDDVRTNLAAIKAATDVPIDNRHENAGGAKPKVNFNYREIYARYERKQIVSH